VALTVVAGLLGAAAGLAAISALCYAVAMGARDGYGLRELAGYALIALAIPSAAVGAGIAAIVVWRRLN